MRGSRSSNHESRITNHESRITNHESRIKPPCLRDPSPSPTRRGLDAAVRAHRQPIAPPTGAHQSPPFLATGHWLPATDHRPLTTGHCSPASPLSPSPARVSESCYTARLNPNTTGLDPNAPQSHTCPPTIPRPPAMSTRSELNVRNLPPANIAPGAAATNRKCSHLSSAAPPIHCGTKSPMPSMPAPPTPGSVSCHEEHATDTILRTFCTKTPSFAHFQSKTDRELTATASCYESPCRYPVTRTQKSFSKSGPSGQIYTIRYPIDTLPIPDFRKIRGRFASHLDGPGPKLDRTGPILAPLRGAAGKETDAATDAATDATTDFDPDFGTRMRCGPRRDPLCAQKTGRLHLRRSRIRCHRPAFSSG